MSREDYRDDRAKSNELILAPGEYCFTQDITTGVVKTCTGPTVVNAQSQVRPVQYNPSARNFSPVALSKCARSNVNVEKGNYAVLHDPASDGSHPEQGDTRAPKSPLRKGERVHIAGPVDFALWPGQKVEVIEGHRLRTNQYLIVRVYDEDAAKASWEQAVMKRATSAENTDGSDAETVLTDANVPEDLSAGQQFIIRGTEVNFYIPPTGVEVVATDDGAYVREARTLESLQYSILIDEDGKKEYPQGPAVVFPQPSQRFFRNSKKEEVFRAVEMNGPIQGMHLKVIEDYTDKEGLHGPKGTKYKKGDELFLTGETTPIYFPCEQHGIIKYDGKTKHFATAIPAGDGRYVMNRHNGVTRMVTGGDNGTMSLPDPRVEVFIRRVLTDSECNLLYPGNKSVLTYNQTLRGLAAKAPTTRRGAVSEGEVTRSKKMRTAMASYGVSLGESSFADVSRPTAGLDAEMGGDEFSRAATYTEPREVTLGNNKFAGVPKIDIWTGYAVMVKDTAGNRRVEMGPKRVLLDYNETLEALTLSRGTPKQADNLLKTAYLRVNHNKVSDLIQVTTSDHVKVSTQIALLVDFVGDDPTAWFNVANYTKLLTDHVRSVLKAAVRRTTIKEFHNAPEDFIRDAILGAKGENGRPGMNFAENGMSVSDVEVLDVTIGDYQIQELLQAAEHETVRQNIELARQRQQLEARQQQEEIAQATKKAAAETQEFAAGLKAQQIERDLALSLKEVAASVERQVADADRAKLIEAARDLALDAELSRKAKTAEQDIANQTAEQALELAKLQAETDAQKARLEAVGPGFSEALLALGNQETLQKVAEATSVQRMLGGQDLVEVLGGIFKNTPLEQVWNDVQANVALSTLQLQGATPSSKRVRKVK